jgi:hypothetical protein
MARRKLLDETERFTELDLELRASLVRLTRLDGRAAEEFRATVQEALRTEAFMTELAELVLRHAGAKGDRLEEAQAWAAWSGETVERLDRDQRRNWQEYHLPQNSPSRLALLRFNEELGRIVFRYRNGQERAFTQATREQYACLCGWIYPEQGAIAFGLRNYDAEGHSTGPEPEFEEAGEASRHVEPFEDFE